MKIILFFHYNENYSKIINYAVSLFTCIFLNIFLAYFVLQSKLSIKKIFKKLFKYKGGTLTYNFFEKLYIKVLKKTVLGFS